MFSWEVATAEELREAASEPATLNPLGFVLLFAENVEKNPELLAEPDYWAMPVPGSLQSLCPVLPPMAQSSKTYCTPALRPSNTIARVLLKEMLGPNSLPFASLMRPTKLRLFGPP
jgi:hypothetical protein